LKNSNNRSAYVLRDSKLKYAYAGVPKLLLKTTTTTTASSHPIFMANKAHDHLISCKDKSDIIVERFVRNKRKFGSIDESILQSSERDDIDIDIDCDLVNDYKWNRRIRVGLYRLAGFSVALFVTYCSRVVYEYAVASEKIIERLEWPYNQDKRSNVELDNMSNECKSHLNELYRIIMSTQVKKVNHRVYHTTGSEFDGESTGTGRDPIKKMEHCLAPIYFKPSLIDASTDLTFKFMNSFGVDMFPKYLDSSILFVISCALEMIQEEMDESPQFRFNKTIADR
jgi:hypothetical protein